MLVWSWLGKVGSDFLGWDGDGRVNCFLDVVGEFWFWDKIDVGEVCICKFWIVIGLFVLWFGIGKVFEGFFLKILGFFFVF